MFWKKFERICNERGESPNGVAKNLGISSGSVTWWKKGKVPHNSTLKRIADYFGITVGYFTGDDDMPVPTPRDTFDIFSIPGIKPVKTKKLPVLGSVACGEPIFAEEEYQGYISVDEDINADFCLLAKGDSMINAGIKDGSIVFVKKQPTVDNGQIAVVLIEDEATLKRVYFDDVNKRLILNPCNDAYTPIIIDNEQLKTGQVRILGKAIACQFKVR